MFPLWSKLIQTGSKGFTWGTWLGHESCCLIPFLEPAILGFFSAVWREPLFSIKKCCYFYPDNCQWILKAGSFAKQTEISYPHQMFLITSVLNYSLHHNWIFIFDSGPWIIGYAICRTYFYPLFENWRLICMPKFKRYSYCFNCLLFFFGDGIWMLTSIRRGFHLATLS